MQGQHKTYTSCPHTLSHASESHHLVPNCLAPDGIGIQKSSCPQEKIHTGKCEINIANLHTRVTLNQFNACYLERDWVRGCTRLHEET